MKYEYDGLKLTMTTETHDDHEVIARMIRDGIDVSERTGVYGVDVEYQNFGPTVLQLTLASALVDQPAPPKTRPMTQAEMIGWAYNEGATGWQVRCRLECGVDSVDSEWEPPLGWSYDSMESDHQRRRVHPDGTYGEPEAFEVTE